MIPTFGKFIVLEIGKFNFRGSSAKSENPNFFVLFFNRACFALGWGQFLPMEKMARK